MPVQKIDPKVIFASNAPEIDKPPVFGDNTKGFDVTRSNDGRPTIKQMNKLQQDTDLKILWLNENSVTPYDESIDYPDGAVALKDGSFKQFVSGAWVEFLDDFANKDEVKRGIANRYDSSLIYNSGERVILTNGDIVKSTVDGNASDPNVDMTGWVKENSTGQIFDASGLSQQEINTARKTVNLVSDLKNLQAKNGDIVATNGHTDVGLGGGVYRFEALSSKADNNGTWIASTKSSGTWVLISDNHIEQFGVLSDGTDQSSKIQAALNFYLDNNIKEFSFEKPNIYSVASPVRFKQRLKDASSNYADPKYGCSLRFNGATLKALTANQIVIVVSRDMVQIEDIIITSSVSGVIGVYNGLDIENDDSTLRRSSMRMMLINPKFDNIDVAMKFEPAETKFGGQWGAFYHSVINPTATFVQIMYEFKQSKGAGDSSNTRNTFINSKHVGGACTVYGEALESSIFIGIESEFINRPDTRLPNGEAVALYLPFGTTSDFQANKQNKFIGFNVEVCTNYVNINAPETHIDGFFQSATNPRSTAWKYNNVYGNLSYTEGGIVLRQYNGTPRFGMQQINDDGTSASLYFERGTGSGDYKISSDGKIEIPATILNNTYATNNAINFKSSDGTKNLQLNFNAELGMYFAGDSGYVGFTGDLRPALDNWSSVGTPERRLKNVISYKLNVTNLAVYADNAAAKTGGLVVGDFYRTSTGQVMVVF